MQREDVDSSNIKALGYDPYTLTAEIEFRNGGLYKILGMTAAAYYALRNADSIGRHYAAEVKGKYPTERVA